MTNPVDGNRIIRELLICAPAVLNLAAILLAA